DAAREPEAERRGGRGREAERVAGGVERAHRAVGEEEEEEPGRGKCDREAREEEAERALEAVRHGQPWNTRAPGRVNRPRLTAPAGRRYVRGREPPPHLGQLARDGAARPVDERAPRAPARARPPRRAARRRVVHSGP